MNKILLGFFGIVLIGLTSCDTLSPVYCDLQFVSVGVEITGAELDRTYTLTDQNDTLHQSLGTFNQDFYTVVDDLNQEALEGEEIDVNFLGFIGDSLVVNEVFGVGANECHVYKVSGKEKIEL